MNVLQGSEVFFSPSSNSVFSKKFWQWDNQSVLYWLKRRIFWSPPSWCYDLYLWS